MLYDSKPVVWGINIMGGCKLCYVISTIWRKVVEKKHFYYCNLYLFYSQCGGRLEIKKIRIKNRIGSHESTFDYIKKYLGFYPYVDLFTSRINFQYSRYFSYRVEPKAEVINAFSVSWYDLSFYCFFHA